MFKALGRAVHNRLVDRYLKRVANDAEEKMTNILEESYTDGYRDAMHDVVEGLNVLEDRINTSIEADDNTSELEHKVRLQVINRLRDLILEAKDTI